MTHFSEEIIGIAGRLLGRAASEQGGIISGDNPTSVNTSDPLRLWVIQVGIIIIFTRLLSLLLGRIRQPRVIAEVIGGVILGPSVMGRIPHFTSRIFPAASIPYLTLTANIGLVFFLFLVGLEIDTRILRRNAKVSLSISAAGLILPFGLGAAVAVPLYHQFIDPSVNYGYFILFVAVAVGITAFPVLCRILTETRLLDTTVGVVVLSAGVGNDVVGWILLALSVALANAASGLTALWVLIACSAYVIFVLYPVRWAYVWLARKTGSLENGQPSTLMMTVTLLLVLCSAFFTDIIGVHPIFGGFVAGLIVPHEGGLAIALVEKLEDLISIVFLPIYFILSGQSTDLGLLNNGITWGYTILICAVAFFGKFIGCFVAAKISGFNLRESGAIGTLMSCKGLVELIVLNIGLQAGILNTRTFSMFVMHAIVLTFMTTPLTLLWYPPKYRTRPTAMLDGKGEKSAAGLPELRMDSSDDSFPKTNFTMVLNNVDHLPAIMTLTQLLQPPTSGRPKSMPHNASGSVLNEKGMMSENNVVEPITVNALRLIELTERTSAVLKSQDADALAQRDSVISVFRTFGRLNHIPISAALSVIMQDEFSGCVTNHVRETGTQMVVMPWSAGASALDDNTAGPSSPFDGVFMKNDKSSTVYSHFVRKVFAQSPVDVALFVDRCHGAVTDIGYGHHIFMPFFGGPDDRLALSFVVQLCGNPTISATVVRVNKIEKNDDLTEASKAEANATAIQTTHSNTIFPDTIYGKHNTQTRLASDTADNLIWARYSSSSSKHTPAVADALKRIIFSEESLSTPLHGVLGLAAAEAKGTADSWKSLLVVAGRGRRMAGETHRTELREIIAEHGPIGGEVPKTLGDVAAAFVATGTKASLLVMQASLSADGNTV